MKATAILFLFTFVPASVVVGNQYKILTLLPMGSKSHKNVFVPLVEGLAARGHDVTVMSPYKPTKAVANIKEIVVDESRKLLEEQHKQMFDTIVGAGFGKGFGSFFESIEKGCRNFLTLPYTQEMIAKGKVFDLVIVHAFMNDCAIVVASLVGKTVIYLNPASMPSMDVRSTPAPASIVPMAMLEMPTKMDFFQRMKNSLATAATAIAFQYMLGSKVQAVLSEVLPDAPTLAEARQEVAFFLYNADPVLTPPLPGISNAVAIGAMHCKDAKPLPKDFEDFIQSSGEHGFIYFSLGSNAPSKYLPLEIRQAFLTTFSRLKQKIIWKFEEDLPNKPDNVMTTKWAPQQDILGHPKIRLFITHGGMLSLQETLYHATPVVGIALFADQPNNMLRVQDLKIGEKLDFKTITADLIYEAVTKILNDKSYAENMKKYSAVLRDQPQKPLERAIFWTEYIIRHNGAHHLRSIGQDLSFIEHYLIDVVAVLVLGMLAAMFVVYKVIKVVLKKARKSSSGASKKKTQ